MRCSRGPEGALPKAGKRDMFGKQMNGDLVAIVHRVGAQVPWRH